MTEKQVWLVLALLAALFAMLYLLAPILAPFFISALLAYMGDPLVDWFEARKLPRTISVIIVFLVIVVIILPMLFLLLPFVEQQISILINKIPGYIDWLQATVLPWLSERLGLDKDWFHGEQIKKAIAQHWQQVGGLAAGIAASVSYSGFVLITIVANILLVPVVTFYLLRDWDVLVARVHELIPRSIEPAVVHLVKDCDEMLGAFMRGQLLVMIALASIYTTGLYIVGLDLALLIGLGAGAVSFVPYLGFIVGILVASIAAILQFHDTVHVLYIVVVFGLGQVVESMVLTPILLGDRIGLHPVLVIFSVMAGGQLFGFFGVLLALPVASVIAVVFRHAHQRYVRSELYGSS